MYKFSKSKLTISIASIAMIAMPSFAVGQSNTDELIVTAKGGQTLQNVLPTSHVFTLDDIDAAQIKDLPALLESIPGINLTDSGGRGSTTGVFIRGNTSSETIVLIDGVRVGSATLGSAALNAFPVEAIERVEVIKGPFSGIYGADAVGGVIQLFTKKSGEGLGSASASLGSDSLTELSLAFSGGNERNSFHLSIYDEDGDGIDRTSLVNDRNDDEDGFEETAISFGGKATLSDTVEANLTVLYSDNTVEFDNTFDSDPTTESDDTGFLTDNTLFSAALNITAQLNEALTWTTTLGINEDESITAAFFSDITTERNSIGSELAYSFGDGNLVTVGVEYFDEEVDTLSNFTETERDNTAIYAQLQASAGDFNFVGSVRYDDNSAYDDETNVSLAVNYDITDEIRATASYGTAFVAPSFNELFFPNFGNENILPAESDSYELTLRGAHSTFDWRASIYRTDVTNLIQFDFNTFLAGNIGEAELEGLELEISTQLAEWDVSASVDFLSADDAITGDQLSDRAEQTIRLTAKRDFGHFDLRFDVRGEDGRVEFGGIDLSSYVLFDVSGSYTINDQWSVQANIDNIFDKDYTVNLVSPTERFNTEGTQAKLTLKYNF